MAKISVIIPVYNTENYISRCLDSILNQTFDDIEIICVNDGSSDNSFEILQKYSKTDSRIKIINQNNNGVSSARNTAIKNSNAEFLFFLDSDDYIEKNCLELAYNKIISENSDFVCCAYNYIKDNKILLNTACHINYFIDHPNKPESYYIMAPIGSKLFRKKFLIKNNIYFNEKLKTAEDFEFVFKSILNNAKISALGDVVYNYEHKRQDSATSNIVHTNTDFAVLENIICSDAFKNADEFLKIACLDSYMQMVIYWYSNYKDKIQKKRIQDIYLYLNKNVSKNILKQCPQYPRIKAISKNIIQKLFSLTCWKRYIENHILSHA